MRTSARPASTLKPSSREGGYGLAAVRRCAGTWGLVAGTASASEGAVCVHGPWSPRPFEEVTVFQLLVLGQTNEHHMSLRFSHKAELGARVPFLSPVNCPTMLPSWPFL